MKLASTLLLRLLALACAMAFFALDASDAIAQSRNCAALSDTLQALNRSAGRNSFDDIDSQVRQAQRDVQQAESQYVRDGCNAAAKAGTPLTSQCKGEARIVIKARAARDNVSKLGDIANQREAVLQDMARFNCDGSGSNATFSQQQSPRGNIFQQLFGAFENGFGGDGTSTRGDEFSGEAGYQTVRTVCVRKADGYYWPISFSTLVDYAPNDLSTCQEQCPGLDVDLYYYQNPGQDPEQMVNLQGEPYKSLPTAFAYRTTIDPALTCKPQVNYGSISLAALPDGSERAIISFEDQQFPLPMRDPRRPTDAKVLAVAAQIYVDVPLPRPRPAAPGEAPKPVVVQQAATNTARIVMFGDKRVRIVGPDTPYAPTEAAGT
jgi:Protein of unknown function (DUF2865)